MQRVFRIVIVALTILALPGVATSQSGPPGVDPRQTRAYQLYSSGDIAESIRLLREVLADTIKSGNQTAILFRTQDLVDICIRAVAVQCVQAESQQLTDLLAKHLNDPYPGGALAMIWGTYYLGNSAYFSGDPTVMQQTLEQFFKGPKDTPNDYISFVRRHLLVAKMRLFLHQPREAIEATNDVLSMIAATKDPRGSRFLIAGWLSDCIGILTDAGDVQRAAGLYDVAGNFIARSFSAKSPEYLIFRLGEADLLIHVGNAKAAASAARMALESLATMTLEPVTKEYLEATVRNTASLTLMLSGDIKSALFQNDSHPLNPKILEIEKRGYLISQPEIAFLATRMVIRAAAGLKPEPADLALLSAPLKIHTDPTTLQALEIYRSVGHAIAIAATDFSQGRQEMIEAGQRLIDLQEALPRGGFNIFVRPDLIGGLVINLSLAERWRRLFGHGYKWISDRATT